MNKFKQFLLHDMDLGLKRITDRLVQFNIESNKIEGIDDEEALIDSYDKHYDLLKLDELTIADLCTFNTAGRLRLQTSDMVKVGTHIPPRGGQRIVYALDDILAGVNGNQNPVHMHHHFETLHPFMDGNGRTGRAIWLWQMVNQYNYGIQLGFLHQWYYQSLEHNR